MSNFTHYNEDPLYAAAAAILEGKQIETPSELEEGVEEIKKKIEGLKVGDKTNFGAVVSIDNNSITFKAKDLPKTKISFNQRKMGSKDFVLDAILKLKEETEVDDTTITEADDPNYSSATNALYKAMLAARKKKNTLFKQLQMKDKVSPSKRGEYFKAVDDWHNLQDKLAKSMETDDKAKKRKNENLEELLDGDIPQLDEEFIKNVNDALRARS
jgi:hypothetical protein